MAAIVSNIRWIMILSGVLTFTMIHAAIAPQAALSSMFGETLQGPLSDIIVRSWGALITIVGAMLIYGAFNPPTRPLVLIVAAVSKAIFIGLVLSQGGRYLGHQAGVAVAVDSMMVALFAWYLLAARAADAR
jgi:nucleoside recognition membrane protein YjiH